MNNIPQNKGCFCCAGHVVGENRLLRGIPHGGVWCDGSRVHEWLIDSLLGESSDLNCIVDSKKPTAAEAVIEAVERLQLLSVLEVDFPSKPLRSSTQIAFIYMEFSTGPERDTNLLLSCTLTLNHNNGNVKSAFLIISCRNIQLV